ncbi:MAG: DUF2267 domain-containing protein [Bradyrhizobium sp.]|nr:DUF2267 domain-containing protein [Pseudomonadota bacterium]MDE2469614.1 DUF2267 domain-containing protein [Bradyrhizobium sp.]
MSNTRVTVLDHTIEETNVWLKGVEEELELDDRHQAYNALRAVLHALRDRIPPEAAVKLGAAVVRGVFEVLWEKLDPGEFEKVMNHLPASLRAMQA